MKRLDSSYGKQTFDEWGERRLADLSDTKSTPREVGEGKWWPVESFQDLASNVAFLTSMNKDLSLLYRGQRCDNEPLATLFRDRWRCFGTSEFVDLTTDNRMEFWRELADIGKLLFTIASNEPTIGLPRHHGLKRDSDIQWSVVQHYELWPTPLLDLTSSLRVAGSFAMNHARACQGNQVQGFVYVFGLPNFQEGRGISAKDQLRILRLQSACPPVAKRAHFQDGFLVCHDPLNDESVMAHRRHSGTRRLVAKFQLNDVSGKFWDDDFPVMSARSLMPNADSLFSLLQREFGPDSAKSLAAAAKTLAVKALI